MTLRRRFVPVLLAASVGLGAAACSGSTSTGSTAVLESTVTVAGVTTSAAATTATTLAPAAPTTAPAPPSTTAPPTTVPTTVAAPTADVFPGATWATGELPAGVDKAVIDAAVDTAFGAPDAQARVRSIVVVHGGKIVYERYHPLDSATTIMDSFSVAKSFTSTVIGLLIGDGKLPAVDQPAPVAAWSDPSDPRHAITIQNLLNMASGLSWTEDYNPGSPPIEMMGAKVASDYVASQPLEAAPGTKFEYSTGTTAILAGLATDALGGPDQLDTYIHQRLLDPIGITSTQFLRDASGRWFGGLGANSTSRDFARFGLLFLNDGVWNGTRLLPEGWVAYVHTPSATNATYGAQWWMLHPDSFEARGLFGQIILVSPKHDDVVVINTTQGGDADTLIAAVYAELSKATA